LHFCSHRAAVASSGDRNAGNHIEPGLWNIVSVACLGAVHIDGRSKSGLWIFCLKCLRGPIRHRATPYFLAVGADFKIVIDRRHILLANVRRQVSLAGGNGESQKTGVKALGMLCCQHPLCLNAELRTTLLETCACQRLTARPCSRLFPRGPVPLHIALAFLLASSGAYFCRGSECRKSYRAGALENCFCGLMRGVQFDGRGKSGLWIFSLEGLRGPIQHRATPYFLAGGVAFKIDIGRRHIIKANVPGQVSPLAFGTKGCSAADVPKVPQAWGLAAPARSASFVFWTSKWHLFLNLSIK
jgi:hypothetical protein